MKVLFGLASAAVVVFFFAFGFFLISERAPAPPVSPAAPAPPAEEEDWGDVVYREATPPPAASDEEMAWLERQVTRLRERIEMMNAEGKDACLRVRDVASIKRGNIKRMQWRDELRRQGIYFGNSCGKDGVVYHALEEGEGGK